MQRWRRAHVVAEVKELRMRTMLNFDDWLASNGPLTQGGYFHISYAVRHLSDADYRYGAWRRSGKVFVRGPVSVLVLTSDAAVRAFCVQSIDWTRWMRSM